MATEINEIKSVNDFAVAATSPNQDILQMDSEHWLVTWRDGTSNGKIQIYEMGSDKDTITAKGTAHAFRTGGWANVNLMAKIDSTHAVIVWMESGNVKARVMAVNTSTWEVSNAGAEFTVEAVQKTPNCVKLLDGTHLLIGWTNASDYSLRAAEINLGTWALSWAGAVLSGWGANIQNREQAVEPVVDLDKYLILYMISGGLAPDLAGRVLELNDSTWALSWAGAEFTIETSDTFEFFDPNAHYLDDYHFVHFYTAIGGVYSNVLSISNIDWSITETQTDNNLTGDITDRDGIKSIDLEDNYYQILYKNGSNVAATMVVHIDPSTYVATTGDEYSIFDGAAQAYQKIELLSAPGTDYGYSVAVGNVGGTTQNMQIIEIVGDDYDPATVESTLAPNANNYLYGSGSLYFKESGESNYLHLGNMPVLEISMTPEEQIEHWENITDEKRKDVDDILKFSVKANGVLEEYSKENFNIIFRGDGAQALGDQAANNLDASETTIEDDRYVDLGHTDLFITKLTYISASGTFTIGETVSGGTSGATGKIAWRTTTYMELINVSGTFQAVETITGGSSTETATITGVDTMPDVVVNDAASPTTRYARGTDYDIDIIGGYIAVYSTSIAATPIYVSADYQAKTNRTIRALAGTQQNGEILFVGNPRRGPRWRIQGWNVNINLSGGVTFISKEIGQINIELTFLSDSDNHPSDPYFKAIIAT